MSLRAERRSLAGLPPRPGADRRARRGRRAARTQRRRQVHRAARPRRTDRAGRRHDRAGGDRVLADAAADVHLPPDDAGSASSSRTTCCSRTCARWTTSRSGRAAAGCPGRGAAQARVAGPAGPRRVAGPPGRALRRPGAAGRARPGAGRRPACCCSTSRWPRSTPHPAEVGPICAATWPGSTARRSWSPTTRSTRWCSPTASS